MASTNHCAHVPVGFRNGIPVAYSRRSADPLLGKFSGATGREDLDPKREGIQTLIDNHFSRHSIIYTAAFTQCWQQEFYIQTSTITYLKMYLSIAFLVLGKVATSSLVPRQTTSCTTPNGQGYCGNTANGCSGGTFYSGYCPGASNIQCCVTPCSTPSGSGDCQYTSNGCSGTFVSGYCPGASTYQVRDINREMDQD